jgi:hypothetical protein
MSGWKTTVALALLVAAGAAVYFLADPGTAPPGGKPPALLDLRGEELTRIDIARRGEVETTLERMSDPSGSYWRISKPIERMADPDAMQQMLWRVSKFARVAAAEAGKADPEPAATGLGDPRLVVAFHAAGGRRETLRFGRSPEINTAGVFFQRDGDDRVYLVEAETFQAFDRTIAQIRSRQVARYETYRAIGVEVRYKFTRPRGKDEASHEFEESSIRRIEKGPETGWYLVKPWEERLDDMKVARLVTDLAALEAEEFQPPGDLKGKGLDPPLAEVTIALNGVEKPVVVHVGDAFQEEDKRRYVHVVGSGEAALVPAKRIDQLPLQRKQFRRDDVFPFPKEKLRAMSVEAPGLGRVRLERRESKVVKEGQEATEVTWEVLEPTDVRMEKERAGRFVERVLEQHVTDFLGRQEDLKLFDLDPPEATLAAETLEGAKHVYHFGVKGEDDQGYMRREGLDEVFAVRGELVNALRRLELNFRTDAVFNVPREKLREVRFEARAREGQEPVSYALRLDGKEKKWKFSDPAHAAVEADDERVGALLAAVNYVEAERFVSKEPDAAGEYRLTEKDWPARLTVLSEGGSPSGEILYFTEDLGEPPASPIHYARFEGSPVVFRARDALVATMFRVPVKRPKPQEGN